MRRSLNIANLKKEYPRTITALSHTGILTILPRSKKLGVIGIDGKKYPAPTQEQLLEIFARNKKLVDRKMRQGFAKLPLTPIAMPIPQLFDLSKTALLKHFTEGTIIQTKQNTKDSDTRSGSVVSFSNIIFIIFKILCFRRREGRG